MAVGRAPRVFDHFKNAGFEYDERRGITVDDNFQTTVPLLSEPGAGRILGCHAFGAHSADLIQEASALMCRNTMVGQLRHMVHIHPTLSEILLAAAEA